MATNIPADAGLDVYYRVNTVGSTTNFDNVNYTQMASDAPITYVQVGSDQFIDMAFSADGLASFDSFLVKLVLKSTNSSAVPRVKDLRVIACA